MNIELAIVASSKDPLVHCFDIRTGVLITSFKGNLSNHHSLALLNSSNSQSEFLLSSSFFAAQSDKGQLNSWAFSKSASISKSILPERLHSIAISNSSLYCAGGGESGRFYLWEIRTGRLIRMFDAHYKKITCIKFTSDDMHIITSGDDSSAHVWSTLHLLDSSISLQAILEPVSTLSGHSLPITDIHVSSGLSTTARIFTSSMDRTCKVWKLTTGECLFTVVCPRSLSALIVDSLETKIFAGSVDGKIFHIDLYKKDVKQAQAYTIGSVLDTSEKKLLVFAKHTDRINQLSYSMDESLLVSASNDGTCIVWDPSPVTSCNIFFQPPEMLDTSLSRTNLSTIPFSRVPTEFDGNNNTITFPAQQQNQTIESFMEHLAGTKVSNSLSGQPVDDATEMSKLKNQISLLKSHNQELVKLNDELYQSVVKSIRVNK
ncbi:WD repeat-containing protein 18 [Globomyces sp. JEL0801]|nr:WD repeat-containing protein 18 [Globomyces sp. JEL0801]